MCLINRSILPISGPFVVLRIFESSRSRVEGEPSCTCCFFVSFFFSLLFPLHCIITSILHAPGSQVHTLSWSTKFRLKLQNCPQRHAWRIRPNLCAMLGSLPISLHIHRSTPSLNCDLLLSPLHVLPIPFTLITREV